jgi:alkylation response protein AidB-like acyl-CoA dehydrogenase
VPKEYGGLDASYEVAGDVFIALGEGDPNVAQSIQPHSCGIESLNFAGDDVVKEAYLRPVGEQGMMITNAYAEIFTKNVLELKVTLRPEGDNYRLNGLKFYGTGSRWADAFFVPALVEGTESAKLAFCPAASEGITIHDDWDGMGQRLTASGTIEFKEVLVKGEHVLPGEPFNVPNSYLGTHCQFILSAIHIGIGRAALNDAIEYLKTQARAWFQSGVESATQDPYIMHHVGQWIVALDCAEYSLQHAARTLDQAKKTRSEEDRNQAALAISVAKASSTEAVLKVTHEFFQVCGTRSTRGSWNFQRHWRNARTLTLHDPVDYKYQMIGDYALNGTIPPVSGWT